MQSAGQGERLVESRTHEGEARAFVDLHARYAAAVHAYLRKTLHSEDDAEDVSQQVFCSIFRVWARRPVEPERLQHWLFRIVRNQAIDHMRHSRHSAPHEPDELDRRRELLGGDGPPPPPGWGSDPHLRTLIKQLPRPQQQVLALLYLGDLSVTETADVLHRSPEDIRQLHHRAQRFLRGRLGVQRAAAAHA